jgi:formamidopyrimidine-DNA glycosylase
LKVALLDQRIVAGLGNIYASEALHHARLSPTRRAASIATRAAAPRDDAHALAASITTVLTQAIARHERPYRASPFRVYERAGEPCLRRGCGGTIAQITQAGRSTYFCRRCQR